MNKEMKQRIELREVFQHLHEHAEISWEEVETTNYLVQLLEEAGFEPKRFQHIPGFTVEIGSGSPVVAIRADMDALWQEVDGVERANHSCGHDAHMTIAVGVLQKLRDQMPETGTVRAIFQPAEELGNGSLQVVQEGAVDDVDYLYGVHVRPIDEIRYPSCAPSIQHGASLFVKGEVKGLDHHGARPHKGVNAIEVIASIMQQMSFVHTDPHIAMTMKMTKVHAGSENLNIIPGTAQFGIDMRAGTNEMLEIAKSKLEHIMKTVSTLYDVPIPYEFYDHVPAAVIDPQAEQFMKESIETVLGDVMPRIITPGADDFHFYTIERPALKATMLALGADVSPGLHDPYMTFEHRAIENGINILADVCLRTLRHGS